MSEISDALRSRGLREIPSEFIEPYLQAMLSVELENLAHNPTQENLDESKANLRGVELFVSRYCGLHSRLATDNIYYGFFNMDL